MGFKVKIKCRKPFGKIKKTVQKRTAFKVFIQTVAKATNANINLILK